MSAELSSRRHLAISSAMAPPSSPPPTGHRPSATCPVCRAELKPKVIIPWLLRRMPALCGSCGAKLAYDKTGVVHVLGKSD